MRKFNIIRRPNIEVLKHIEDILFYGEVEADFHSLKCYLFEYTPCTELDNTWVKNILSDVKILEKSFARLRVRIGKRIDKLKAKETK